MMGWGLDDGFNFAMSVGQSTEDIHQAVGKMGSEQQEVRFGHRAAERRNPRHAVQSCMSGTSGRKGSGWTRVASKVSQALDEGV